MKSLIEFENEKKWCQFIKNDNYDGNIPDDVVKDDMINAMNLTNEESIFIYTKKRKKNVVIGIFKYGINKTDEKELRELLRCAMIFNDYMKKEMEDKRLMFS